MEHAIIIRNYQRFLEQEQCNRSKVRALQNTSQKKAVDGKFYIYNFCTSGSGDIRTALLDAVLVRSWIIYI